MTKEEALSLRMGDRVIAHRTDRLKSPKSVEKIFGQTLTVINAEKWNDDVMICVEGCDTALYWDEIDFVSPAYIDETLDESAAGNIFDLFGGVF